MKTYRINNKTKSIFIALSYLFVITLFSNVNFAQDEVIKVDTNLITVPVTVTDRDGRYITNLKKDDFQIFDTGVEENVDFFRSVNEPITVLLLLDISGSMSYHLADLTTAATAFVNQLRPNDQVMATTFADDVYTVFNFTEVKHLEKGFKLKQRRDSTTRLYDAVDYSLHKMKKIRGRKAIVVFSDGAGEALFASAKSNIKDAEEGEAIIYTVQFDTFSNTVSSNVSKKKLEAFIKVANTYMQTLAQITGGRRYQVEDISDLEKTFAQVANELSQQYSLGYYPKETGVKGERRQIKVRVNIPNAAVRARDIYVVGEQKNKKK